MELFKLWGEIGIRNADANKAIKETTGQAESGSNKMISAFKKIGTVVATAFATEKIISFGKEIVNVAAEVGAETSAFEQIMGSYSDAATEKMGKVAEATGVAETRLTSAMTSMTAKFKGLGFDISDATDLAARGLTIASDAAAFWDTSLSESQSHLNSFINGSYEGGEAIGLFANDTQMAAFAVQEGIVASTKEWANLDEATKQATRLEYAERMMEQSGATGQAAKEAEQYANVQANLAESWRQFKALIGEPLLQNIVVPAMNALYGVVNDKLIPAFQNFKEWISENKSTLETIGKALVTVAGFVVAFGLAWEGIKIASFIGQAGSLAAAIASLVAPLVANTTAKIADIAATVQLNLAYAREAVAMGLAKVKMIALTAAQKAVTAAQWLLNAALNANPISLIVIAIVALIGVFILLWNKCEGFRNFWINLWENIKVVLSTAWEFIKTVFTTALEIISVIVTTYFTAIKTIIQTIFTAVITVVTTVWNGITTAISTAIGIIKGVVSAGWSAIKTYIINPISSAYNTVSSKFTAIKNTITTKINAARDAVKKAIDKIKGFFNFTTATPHIKLPHFSISPAGWSVGDLLKGKIPKLSISWYKKAMDNAMLLNSATIFGAAGGQLLGAGEAGTEVVSGASTLMGMIREAVRTEDNTEPLLRQLIGILYEYMPDMAQKNIVLDTGVLVGQIAPAMDSTLGKISNTRKRGQL